MREVIIRRSIYDPNTEHRIYETETEGEWEYIPPESWMPVYLNLDGDNIKSIDGEGFGEAIYVGSKITGYPGGYVFEEPKTVEKIFIKDDNHFILKLV